MNIFMSYSSADAGLADQLRDGFRELGVGIQVQRELSPGTEWGREVREGLSRSDAVLLIVPEAGTPGANNAFFEAGAGRALGKPVMAVVPGHEAERVKDLPSDLVGYLMIDEARRPIRAIAETVVSALKAA